MKNSLSKVVLAAMMASAPLAANYSYDTHSLFAIEGGMSQIDVESTGLVPVVDAHEKEMGHVGLKIGAEGEDFRAFLSGRYYNADTSEDLSTVGGELQYKFNFADAANFFIGGNAGMAYVTVGSNGIYGSESIATPYFGGDAGFNFHASKLIDVEIGAKYMSINDEITQGTYTHKIDSIVSAYASVIIKWKMD